ncbi:MAG TPA: ABC transporter substrate-binding protein [Acetobacteraceae bacterium]|nr:ABC transporter substrate-binding protein [Acetobacteraceae bacterium]
MRGAALGLPLLLIVLLARTAGATPPRRVVSLNLCTDQMLLLLAPQSAAALSPLARDPSLSAMAAEAARIPRVPASAEAVLRLHPDLVLAEPYGAQATVAALTDLGQRVVTLPDPASFPEIRATIAHLAAILGAEARGAALIAAMDRRLTGLPRPAHPPTAILLEPRGLAAGPASLAGSVLAAAGFRDAARGGWLSLEILLAHPPDLLVVPTASGFPSLATRLLADPALAAIPRRTVPAAWLICGTPFAAQAARMIARR